MSTVRLNVINSDGGTLQINSLTNNPTSIGATTPVNISSTGIVTINNTTASTSNVDGALILKGGLGVDGAINANTANFTSLSAPHSGLTGLTLGDDHTQYALLAGRTTGQILTGGTAGSANLTLRSTSNATKGSVHVDETTEASSATVAAFKVAGGVGIAKKLFVTGAVSFSTGLNMNNTLITDVADPVNDGDAVNKSYVDTVAQGLQIKDSVRLATTGPLTLATDFENGDTLDGFALVTGDRILIKNQTNGIENGIYVVQVSGSPVRASDFLLGTNQGGAFAFVEEGTQNGSTGWVVTNLPLSDVVGTDILIFSQFSGAGQIVAGTGLTKLGNELSVNASLTHVTDVGTLNSLSVAGLTTLGTTNSMTVTSTGDIDIPGLVTLGTLTASKPLALNATNDIITSPTTGTGSTVVLDTSPTLITPILGVASATSLTTSGALTVNGITTLGASNSMTVSAAGAVSIPGTTTFGSLTASKPLALNGSNVLITSPTTGTGSTVVLDTSPTLVTPILGVASATSLTASSGISLTNSTGSINTATRINSIGRMVNSTTAGNAITTDLKAMNKRIRTSNYNGVRAVDNWYLRSGIDSTKGWNCISWSPELNLFLALQGSNPYGQYSSNSINWNNTSVILVQGSTININPVWSSVTWAPELGRFLGVAITNGVDLNTDFIEFLYSSLDGTTLNFDAEILSSPSFWTSVCWSSELTLAVAVGLSTGNNQVMTSTTGLTWTRLSGIPSQDWRSVCWSPELNLFVAVASSGTGNRVMTSPDGSTWTSRTSASDNDWYSVCWSSELYLFVAVSITGTGNRVMTSPDGINWTSRTSAADQSWRSVIWVPDLSIFVAIAFGSTGVMYSFNGINWTSKTSAAANNWTGIAWSPELSIMCSVSSSGTTRGMTTNPALPNSRSSLLTNPAHLSINSDTGVLSSLITTASTSTTTGAVTIAGGLGVAGALYAGSANFTTLSAPHSGLSGLLNDDHTQYALLAGRSGGQVLTGGTASGNNLTLRSTTNATKGSILLDEVTASSSSTVGAFRLEGGISISNTTDATSSTNGGTFTTAGGIAVAKKVFIGTDLNVLGISTLGATNSLTVSAAGVVTVGGAATFSAGLTSTAATTTLGTSTIGAITGTSATFSGNVTVNGITTLGATNSLTVSAAGVVTVGGAATFSGNATVNGITTLGATNSLTVSAAGVVTVGGAATFSTGLTSTAGTTTLGTTTIGAITGTSATFSGNVTVNGITTLGATNSLTVSAAGVVTVGGAATFSAGLTSTAGTTSLGTTNISGLTNVTNSTDASNSTTAALKTAGGIASALQMYSGGNINTDSFFFCRNTTTNPPTFTTARSTGTKIVLLSAFANGTSADYAIGVESNSIWYGVPTTTQSHRFYHGTTNTITFSNTTATFTSAISGTSATFSGNVTVNGISTLGATNSLTVSAAGVVTVGGAATFSAGLTSTADTTALGTTTTGTITTTGKVSIGGTDPLTLGRLFLTGTNANAANGPHTSFYTASDAFPLFQQLNWTHDDISLGFDIYYDGTWRRASTTASYQIYKRTGELAFLYVAAGGSAGADINATRITGMKMNGSGLITLGSSTPVTVSAAGVLTVGGAATFSAGLTSTAATTTLGTTTIGAITGTSATFSTTLGVTGLSTLSGNVITPIITGSTASGGTLTLRSTTNATKGSVFLDEDNSVFIVDASPEKRLGIVKKSGGPPFFATGSAASFDFRSSSTTTIDNVASTTYTSRFTISAAGVVNIPGLTASQAVFTDGSDNLVSVAVNGTGNVVLTTSPTLVTPVLGVASATSLTASGNITSATLTVATKNITPNTGDITSQVTFTGAQSASNANVTGLSFSTASTRSFKCLMSVVIVATSSLYAQFELSGIYNGSTWYFVSNYLGDNTNVTFGITAAGQVTYSSTTYTGFSSLTMKFKATTIAI